MTESERQRREDEVHRAVGRYVVAFSYLIYEMRDGIEYTLRGDDPMNARLALGEAFAQPVANAYFAICERRVELDDEEKQVGVALKNEVGKAIKNRNDFAHGDWHMPFGEFEDPRLLRTKPGRRAGAWVEHVRPIDEIDALTDEVESLAEQVIEFGWLCLRLHPLTQVKGMDIRVRDIFRFQRHRGVLSKGRYANVPWFEDD
jgi:hypothetical protein